MTRATPVSFVFGSDPGAQFATLCDAIARDGRNDRDADELVLVAEAVDILQSLHPDDADPDTVTGFVSFLHAAYLFWLDGEALVEVDRAALDEVVRTEPVRPLVPAGRSCYVQLAPRRVWGEPVPGQRPEPVDGWFARPAAGGALQVLAVFGLHPERPGLTVVEEVGARPGSLERADGSPPFAPRLEGGERAGLWSIAGGAELLELAHRCHARLGPDGPAPGPQPLPRPA